MNIMKLEAASVLVLGGGKSGVSAVKFLLKKNALVMLYDGSAEKKPVYEELAAAGCTFALGKVPDLAKHAFDFAVISPGIPLTDPCAAALAKHNIPIWGELELASRFITKPIIGITGTNGKTTTTTLIGEILKNAGFRTFVGGNIGIPLLDSLEAEYDYYVVEMSSFQLETIATMNAAVSLFLNLTPDHLNRHGSMEGYLAAKANLCTHQSKDHYTVLNYDDAYMRSLRDIAGGEVFWFTQKDFVYAGTSVLDNGDLVFNDVQREPKADIVMNAADIRLPGPHNLENCMGAITVTKLLGIQDDVIAKTLAEFAGVEHRLEDVMTYKGVRYVNDSKATNPDSVFKALASYGDAPIILIAGGRNKGNNFDALGELIRKKCKSLILIGEAAEDMAASAKKTGMTDITIVEDMAAAVALAHEKGEEGDVVLLSPANASFDQFNSFEHRGQVFKDIVLKLKGRKANDRTKEKTT